MGVEFRLVHDREPLAQQEAVAAFMVSSPWEDIPLRLALLALRLDGHLPATVDWNTPPGSEPGVQIYLRFAELRSRWLDTPISDEDSIDVTIDREFDLIDYERDDVRPALEQLLETTSHDPSQYMLERTIACGLLGLSRGLTRGYVVHRVSRPPQRDFDGPIYYYTAGLEGFDEIESVEIESDGSSIRCRFVCGYCYRIPLAHLVHWTGITKEDARIVEASIGVERESLRLKTSTTEDVEVSAAMILRYCEPAYVDASPRSEWEERLLQQAIERYGSLRIA